MPAINKNLIKGADALIKEGLGRGDRQQFLGRDRRRKKKKGYELTEQVERIDFVSSPALERKKEKKEAHPRQLQRSKKKPARTSLGGRIRTYACGGDPES
jgi:hypothetical protein